MELVTTGLLDLQKAEAELADAVRQAKRDDPLAPVTVVCPSGYAALYVRRMLGSSGDPGSPQGVANLEALTTEQLVKKLGAPVLSRKGIRAASRQVELEALRSEASSRGGWIGRFVSNPRALVSLSRAVQELGRCPAGALAVISSRSAQAADLVGLLNAVTRRLHGRGFAEANDLAAAALEGASLSTGSGRGKGEILTWQSGPLSGVEAELLQRLHAHAVGTRSAGSGPESVVSVPTRQSLTEIVSCPDASEEARSALREVISAAEYGIPLWAQAIFHPPGSATYARVLHQQLSAAGVAVGGPSMRRLDATAASRAFVGLLDLIGGDLARDDVVAWLKAAPVRSGRGPSTAPSTTWDVISAEAGVVKGIDQWRERLRLYSRQHGDHASETDALADFITGLAGREPPKRRSWTEHTIWATGLLDDYLAPLAPSGVWPVEELAALEQIRLALGSLGELDEISEGTDPARFKEALQSVLSRTNWESDTDGGGAFGDGVFVAPIALSRGIAFEQVIVCGLADALVPGPGYLDSLLSEEVRASDTSGTLRTRNRDRSERLDDVLTAVGAGRSRRIGTVPRSDPRSGRAHVNSRWIGLMSSPLTSWRTVDSFASALGGRGPALSGRDLELRSMERWVSCGGDAAVSPIVRSDARLAAGFDAVRSRAGSDFTRFDGLVGPGKVSPFDPERPVSATRFETYAHCPRRYLFERALGASRRVRPEELWRIEPPERGSLVHAILEEYVSERVEGAPRSLDRLLEVAEHHLDQAEAGGLVGKRLIWRMDRAAILRELRRFHSEERDLEPIAAELAFGDPEAGLAAVQVTLDDGRTINFRGSADRVDRSVSGALVVSDYKTGKQAALNDLMKDPVASGTLLQLPLYGMAARQRFATEAPVHARYWLLSSERTTSCYSLVLTPTVEKRFRDVVARIASGVEEGCFPGIPGAQIYDGRFENCRRCDFDALCSPHRDREWTRKATDLRLVNVVKLVQHEAGSSWSGTVVKGFGAYSEPDLRGAASADEETKDR